MYAKNFETSEKQRPSAADLFFLVVSLFIDLTVSIFLNLCLVSVLEGISSHYPRKTRAGLGK